MSYRPIIIYVTVLRHRTHLMENKGDLTASNPSSVVLRFRVFKMLPLCSRVRMLHRCSCSSRTTRLRQRSKRWFMNKV
jgi:hypothetical protein